MNGRRKKEECRRITSKEETKIKMHRHEKENCVLSSTQHLKKNFGVEEKECVAKG
jgi:hypothetical protein